jgi:hypothetical protein
LLTAVRTCSPTRDLFSATWLQVQKENRSSSKHTFTSSSGKN